MTKKLLLIYFFIVLLGWGIIPHPNGISECFAQPQTDSALQNQLRLARHYENAGQFNNALQIYNDLDKKYPGNFQVFDGLRRCYLGLKKYDELIVLLENKIKSDPTNINLHLWLGETLIKVNKMDKAKQEFDKIISIAPNDQNSYFLIASVYLQNGMTSSAIETYLLGRKMIKDDSIFAQELAYLYEIQSDYESALKEYINLLGGNPGYFQMVKNKLLRLVEQGGDISKLIPSLEKVVNENPKNANLRRLLGELYIKSNQGDKAFVQFQEVEKIERRGGSAFLELGTESEALGNFETALKAYQEIINNYAGGKFVPQAHLGLARSHLKLGNYNSAISSYIMVTKLYPRSPESEQSYFQIGDIYQNNLAKPDSAIQFYSAMLNEQPFGRYRAEAGFRIADCYVMKGDLAKATQEYQNLTIAQQPAIIERALFELSEIFFIQKDFKNATQAYRDITTKYPTGKYVNDALDRVVFISENQDYGTTPLSLYADAELLIRQHQFDKAIETYMQIIKGFPKSAICDDVYLALASLYERKNDFINAEKMYKDLISNYPDSNLLPETYYRLGELYSQKLNNKKSALDSFEVIIDKYSTSLFVDKARKRIRELQ